MMTNAGYSAVDSLMAVFLMSFFMVLNVLGVAVMWKAKKEEVVHTSDLDIQYQRTRQGGVYGYILKRS